MNERERLMNERERLMNERERVKAARKELAGFVAKPLFGEGTDPARVKVSVDHVRKGDIYLLAIVYETPDVRRAYTRNDYAYQRAPSVSHFFYLCEKWLTLKVREQSPNEARRVWARIQRHAPNFPAQAKGPF